jgi:hypothetical protein
LPNSYRATAGRLCYQHAYVANPAFDGRAAGLFSEEMTAKIRDYNTPARQVVYFDGRHSRIDEINTDYGVRSPSFQLRSVGDDKITYGKDLANLSFCVEHAAERPVGGPPPVFAPTGETVMITGLLCHKAEYQGGRHLLVWYTNGVHIEDPTGAVLALEGVPGLILQTEQVPRSDREDTVERITVTALSFEAPPPEIFSVPAGYRRFDSVDAARAEDRRIADAKAIDELRRHPLSAAEHDMFVGEWLLDTSKDKVLVEVTRLADDEFLVRTTVLTAPHGMVDRIRHQQASLKGRLLMVEDPPNYNMYRTEGGGRYLILVGNELFTFVRQEESRP